MKYIGMPMGMWVLFGNSFERSLITELGFDRDMAKSVAVKAKPRYKEIIAGLPEFEKADRNPYSWNMEFYPYPDGSGYEAMVAGQPFDVIMRYAESLPLTTYRHMMA